MKITVDTMIRKIKEYQKKFKTLPIKTLNWISLPNWEYELLKDTKGITPHGIAAEYPMAVVTTTGGEKVYKDLDGDLKKVREAVGMFNSENKSKESARIEYMPRAFPILKEAKKEMFERELEKERKDKFVVKTPPVQSFMGN